MLSRSHSRGDTLIEVLLAMTVMSVVIALTLRTMNAGFATIFSTTEHSEVQSFMNSQVAILRAAHDNAERNNPTDWNSIVALAESAGTTAQPDGCSYLNGTINNKFYFINSDTTAWTVPIDVTAHPNPVSNQPIASPGDGLWIEGIKGKDNGVGSVTYYDFYIKACWHATGEGPDAQLKTVVRLYAPV